MTAITTAEPQSPATDWEAERWAQARPFLADLVEHVPADDDPEEDRLRAVDFAAQRAEQLAAVWPTQSPGARARGLLEALHEVRLRQPRAKPDPKGAPQNVAGLARLASELAADPAAAERIDVALVPALDKILGGLVLARYHADVEQARERLAESCEELLGRIPGEWRRSAGAPTRAERVAIQDARAAMGVDL